MKVPTGVRAEVLRREGGACLRCGTNLANVPSSIHHRKPRGMGGTKDPRSFDLRNLVHICGDGTRGCHGDIESHRSQAHEDGWLILSYDDLDRPVRTVEGLVVSWLNDGHGLVVTRGQVHA